MVAARRIIALSVDADQRLALVEISRSRTEPANRVERARIILAYLEEPSAYAVACAMRVSQQTVTRCLERAAELGVLAALDDRARPGRDARITVEARTWLVGLACAKPTQFGYPHELWTTRLLAAHARDHGPRAGHPSLANLAQGTVCKILAAHEVKRRCQVILSRSEKPEAGWRDHTATTAFRHSLAASARRMRSVDRETRWR